MSPKRRSPIHHTVHTRDPRYDVPQYGRGHGKPIRTLTEVRKAGMGVGSIVRLTRPMTNTRTGQLMDAKYAPKVGDTGKVIGHFGAEPVVQWEGKKGGQVVNPNELDVIGKKSMKREIIASISRDKLEREAANWAYMLDITGNKVTLSHTQEVYSDMGYGVGDITYSLIGVLKRDGTVDFVRTHLDTKGVPRRYASSYREMYDSQDPKDEFRAVFE